MHGGIFIEVNNGGKRKPGTIFEADVSINAREACTERTCKSFRQAKEKECPEEHFKGSLVVWEDDCFSEGDISSKRHIINSLKGIFQKNL